MRMVPTRVLVLPDILEQIVKLRHVHQHHVLMVEHVLTILMEHIRVLVPLDIVEQTAK